MCARTVFLMLQRDPHACLFGIRCTSAALTHHPDGMPRWPSLTSAPGILRASDWIGTVTFSVGGCVLAGTA